MNKIYFYTVLTLIAFLTISCTKDEVKELDKFNTKINIVTPILNDNYVKGDTVFINAEITSDVSMHGYEIIIHNQSSGLSFALNDKHTHGKIILIEDFWVVDIDNKSEIEVEVIAAIDHLGNNLSEKRTVLCN